jgi:bleomycin hydrolase
MKRIISTVFFIPIFFLFISTAMFAQESYYGIKSVKKIVTSSTKDLQRPGSCWSNAGAALLEAEMLKGGKKDIDLSEMGFVHNAYLQKAGVYLKNKGKIRVGEDGMASDVIKSIEEFGMVPETGYMKSDKDPFGEDAGEMDAILRGTLKMVLDKENGNFSERWKNTYDAALGSYIGEPRINFKYKDKDFTPKSFAEASGIKANDYILISSDDRQEMNKPFVLPIKSNWSEEKAFNVTPDDLAIIMKSSIEKGFTLTWYGDVVQKSVFANENVALVPATNMPGEKTAGTEKIVMEPVAEKEITSTERQEKFKSSIDKELGYMLVYGLRKDKKDTEYLVAKNVCESGDKELNLSGAYIKLNTVFLLLNKNGLSAEMKDKLGL